MAFLGKMIRSVRAGESKIAIQDPAFAQSVELPVRSDAFADGGPMPPQAVGSDGEFPTIHWGPSPQGTQSLALIVEDYDVPLPAPLVHAIAYGIAPAYYELPARTIPRAGSQAPPLSVFKLGRGFAGEAYAPPTPIPGHGPHHYAYQVFALDNVPTFAHPPSKNELVEAMHGHVIACGAVIGTHEVN